MAHGHSWVILSLKWNIGDVRAILAFLINVLCAVGVWAVAYASWKFRALRALKSSRVDLLSLLSMTGVGDALDAFLVLRTNMSVSRSALILAQGLAVTLLSATAVLSGPIARYSIRQGVAVRESTISGWLATTNHSSMGGALLRWNDTITSLNKANFPYDQLLDFQPDHRVPWIFESSQWNSSWTAACKFTPQMSIKVSVTGNYTDEFFDEFPDLLSIFPKDTMTPTYRRALGWRGAYENSETLKDVLSFILVETNPNSQYDLETDDFSNSQPLHLVVAAVHMRGIPSIQTDDAGNFGVGHVEKAEYSMTDCVIQRNSSATPNKISVQADAHVAYPWTNSTRYIVQAFANFHEAPLIEQSFTGAPIYHPSGEDLFRFYQAYMISKDTQYKQTVERPISVGKQSVELSVVTLSFLLAYVLCILGIMFWFMVIRRLPNGVSIPRTKIEWMMQALRETGGREVDGGLFDSSWSQLQGQLRKAAIGETIAPSGRPYMGIQLPLDSQSGVPTAYVDSWPIEAKQPMVSYQSL